MRRRTLLSTVAAGAASGLAGCGALTGESTPIPAEELPAVTVEYRWFGGLSPVGETVLTVEADEVRFATSCRREDERGIDIDRYLDTETYRQVQRRVVQSLPQTWKDVYPCRNACADDAGTRALSVAYERKFYETTIDPLRTPPARIRALTDLLKDIEDQFHDLDLCLDGDV